MNGILNSLVSALVRGHMGGAASTFVKSEAGVNYVTLVKSTKAAVVALYTMWIMTGSVILSAFIFIFSALNLCHVSADVVYLVMTILGGILFLGSFGVLLVLRSDKFWMKLTKINEMVANVSQSQASDAKSSEFKPT